MTVQMHRSHSQEACLHALPQLVHSLAPPMPAVDQALCCVTGAQHGTCMQGVVPVRDAAGRKQLEGQSTESTKCALQPMHLVQEDRPQLDQTTHS